TLERQLAFREKELDIILAIDHIRDTASKPTAMFSGIVDVVIDQFHATMCLLYIINPEDQRLELKALRERNGNWQQVSFNVDRDKLQALLERDDIKTLTAAQLFDAQTVATLTQDIYLIGIPIFMDTEPLGLLLIGRDTQPFAEEEIRLLETTESQIDSAVIQAHNYEEMVQRNRELETIYHFDRIRDQNLPFDEMLDVVLEELCHSIEAEMGFVMLYNQAGERLEMRALTHEDIFKDPACQQLINELANEAIHKGELICNSHLGNLSCAVMAIPLILRNEIIGVFGALNQQRQRGFTSNERQLLRAIVSQMDTAILESLERRRLRQVLGRSVDPNVLEQLLAKPDVDLLKGERTRMTVLYADLRGSTSLAERLEPEMLVEYLNNYLGQMTEVVLAHKGTLDKFVGDEVMALFGAPLPQPDHALRAARTGLQMQARHEENRARWREARGAEAPAIGVGIATGDLIVGEIGCEQRTDYTVIGRAANLGARICSIAKPGQVLISQPTYDLIRDDVIVEAIPDQRFKGIDEPVTVYNVQAIKET
ncbi:MAG: adenylate/guanylate cyclase domain-containing protein, partial [Anaerolineales bacterium]